MEGRERPLANVSCLYPEILALIFSYLDVRDKGRAAQVCSAWREAAYNKSVWRGVEAKLHLKRSNPTLFHSLVQRGIRRVQVLSLKRSLRDVVHGIPNIESLNLTGCYNLSDNWLTQGFIQDVNSLTVLNLSMCKQITDASLMNISQHLKNLEFLDLGGCSNISNMALLLIAEGLQKLKSLHLRSCCVSDVGISHLAGLKRNATSHIIPNNSSSTGTLSLEHLSLQDCYKITDEGLRHLSDGLHNLKILNLSFCASITDIGLKHLARMGSLRELNLQSVDTISDLGLAYLAENNSRLTILDVSFCNKVGDQGLLHISQGLFNLRSLSIKGCPITDEGLGRIARTLTDLRALNIGQCDRITDKGLSLVSEHLHKLLRIDLYGCNKITTVGLEKVMQLPQLIVLNLGLWEKR